MQSLADEIINENIANVAKLLRHGVNVNDIDEYGYTPLIEAAIMDNVEIAELLIRHGANVNQHDMTGGTALHWASENNNLILGKLLLDHKADPNSYTVAGQPVLVMPLLRNQQQFKNLLYQYGADLTFAQDYINTKLLGHMFELVGHADIISPTRQFVEVDFEGFILEFTLGIIGESVAQFQNHFAARQLRNYSELLHAITSTLMNACHLVKFQQYRVDIKKHQPTIRALLQREPLLIPIGYEGHAITFTKFDNIWVKCDRREESRLYDNIVFFHVNNSKYLVPEFFQKLLYEKQGGDFINHELEHILQLEPLTEMKVEAQISGNCSWANVEAALPVIFFLLLAQNKREEGNIEQYKSIALSFFHQWREWNKDRALQFCIQSFREADPVRKASKAEIMAAILFQCDLEKPRDKNRIESILEILMLPDYEYILQNYIRSYVYESYTEEGKHFANILKAYGYKI